MCAPPAIVPFGLSRLGRACRTHSAGVTYIQLADSARKDCLLVACGLHRLLFTYFEPFRKW